MAHVFVVDDDPDMRFLLRAVLDERGYVVTEASDGLPALEHLRASRWPLVVLLDLKMPGLGGAGVLGTVASDRVLAQRHRYILVTANAATLPLALGTLVECLGVPIVQKPFECEALLDVVAQLAQELASTAPEKHAGNGTGKRVAS